MRARRVAFATGGYTAQGVNPLLDNRIMPVLSNSLVTRALSPAELEAAGLKSTVFITDTRTLRFYYRLLPDGRVQIGSRSAVHGADAEPAPPGLAQGRAGASSPALRDVDVDYSWWGWVDVSHDMMPRVTQPDPAQQVYYAFGYGGNGVSFSAHAGRRLAQLMGQDGLKWDLPIYDSPLAGPSVRAVPPARPEPAVPLVLPARRDVVKTGPACRPSGRRPHAVAAHHRPDGRCPDRSAPAGSR